MVECATCKKVLKNEAALLQHCKDKGHPYIAPGTPKPPGRSPIPASAWASGTFASSSTPAIASSSGAHILIECTPCCITFNDKASYDQHVASKHAPKPFKCAPCGLDFSSAEALSIHFRHFAVHPKCPHCNSAFIDQTQLNLHQAIHPKCTQCGAIVLNRAQLEEHVVLAHPAFKCTPCGREYASAADRKRHYQDSPSHPICFVCREGFADDLEIDNHLSRAHIDAKCRLCNRQFLSVEDLQSHFLTSSAHPHCALCEIGFPDDGECDKHMEINHPRPPPRMPSPEPRMPSPVGPASVDGSPAGSHMPSHSTHSSPLGQRLAVTVNGVPTRAFVATLRDESDPDDDTYQTVEASSHVQRAVSEPTVPTVSSIGYGSVHDHGLNEWRSPTLSERSIDYPNMPRHPDGVTLSLQSASSSASGSPICNGHFITELPPSSMAQRVPEMITGRTESLISQGVSPRIQSPITSTRSFSSISEHLSRNIAPAIRPSLSRQPTPRIPSPVLSPVRPMSRTAAATHGPKAASCPGSSLKPSTTTAPAPPSDDTEETVPGVADSGTPKPPKAVPLPLPKPKATTSSWHCRICKQDPCAVPIAAMCGHIFCTACILQELVKTGSCPVCRRMILLRLQVGHE